MDLFKESKNIRNRKKRPHGEISSKGKFFEMLDAAKKIQFIINNSPMPLEKFTESYNIKHLSDEPIYKFTDIIIQNGKKLFVFNKPKYFKQRSKNFPEILEWSKPLLAKLKL